MLRVCAGILVCFGLIAGAIPQSLSPIYRVDELRRLAISPELDGIMQPEEWEPLSTDGGVQSYFQWEPGRIFWAATANVDQAIVLSADLSADGWLKGGDNLEIRIYLKEDQPTFTVRLLDASTPAYRWQNGSVPPGSIRFEYRKSGDNWTLEASLETGPNIAAEGRSVGIRIDSEPAADEPRADTDMRGLANVTLNFDTHKNLPPGIKWKPIFANRTIAVADAFRVTYDLERQFDGPKPIKFEFRAEGLAQGDMATINQPLGPFDNNNRNRFEIQSPIRLEAKPGWRVVRAKLYDATGEAFVMRSSMRVAPLVDITSDASKIMRPGSRWRGKVTLNSNAISRLEGAIRIEAPNGWTVNSGQESQFRIGGARGRADTRFDIDIPENAYGEYYIVVTAVIGNSVVRQPIAVLIESE